LTYILTTHRRLKRHQAVHVSTTLRQLTPMLWARQLYPQALVYYLGKTASAR